MLLTQAATLVTVTYFRHKFMEDVAIGYIVTTIRTLRAAVSQVPAEERAEFVRAASQNQWRLWSRVLPVERGCSASAAAIRRRPGRAEAAAGQRHARAARAGDMTREEDEERSAARAAERMLDRREGGSPYRSEVDDVRRDLRGLVQQLNERLNDGTRVALSRGPTPEIFISLAPNSDSEDVPRLREWLVIPLERLDPPCPRRWPRPGWAAWACCCCWQSGFPGTSRVRSRAWPMPPTAWPPDSRNAWIRPVRPRPGRWASVSTPCWTRWPNRIPCGARCWPGCRMT